MLAGTVFVLPSLCPHLVWGRWAGQGEGGVEEALEATAVGPGLLWHPLRVGEADPREDMQKAGWPRTQR